MKRFCLSLIVGVASIACGCAQPPDSTTDFVLPAGDVAAGEATFLRMRCYDCHRLTGVDLPVAEEPNQVLVALGGATSKVTTYGDLLTSIVNPSHRLAPGYTKQLITIDGESKMTHYNDVMKVSELINLVAYLQTKYQVKKPVKSSRYPSYGYPY
jgi:hypothetical protein